MNQVKPTWIVFDVGGVLLDWFQSSAALAEYLGVSHEQLLNIMFSHAPKMNIGVISPQEGWKIILKELGQGTKHEPNEIIRKWRDKKFWIPETLQVARDLHNSGYRLATFTNSWLGLGDEPDKTLLPDELQLFEYIVDSSKEGLRKPNMPFYDLLESRIGASSSDIFFIDDADKNFPPAQEKGWQTFLFVTEDSKESAKKLGEQLL